MEEKPKKIIIKNIKKSHGGHHGGSWKVAYADFVTALMAFFLLMWLLNMSSEEKRAVMAMYFRHFSLFQQGGQSFMMEGGLKPAGKNSEGSDFVDAGEKTGGMTKEETVANIMSGIEKSGQGTKEQVLLAVGEDGIRIQIVDIPENPVFPPGSAQMTEAGKKIVRSVASILKNFPNELAIEGHTDASPTRNGQVSNWELSTSRASAARREVEGSGIGPDRIARVVGFADKDPLIKDAPEDPRNRRISIVFMKGKTQKPVEQMEWLWRQPAKKQ
ncbi:MAG: flagellar motor protein MotB [Syntrophobacteraceae bacterium]|nr:OmpA family protein [Desulfobacteraceae bacterium]